MLVWDSQGENSFSLPTERKEKAFIRKLEFVNISKYLQAVMRELNLQANMVSLLAWLFKEAMCVSWKASWQNNTCLGMKTQKTYFNFTH